MARTAAPDGRGPYPVLKLLLLLVATVIVAVSALSGRAAFGSNIAACCICDDGSTSDVGACRNECDPFCQGRSPPSSQNCCPEVSCDSNPMCETATPTAMPTVTPTATITDTPTQTPTDTPTATPTSTATNPPTVTPTATATATPTATNTPADDGAPCTSDSQCGSGNCVDDVCCDTECNEPDQICNLAGSVGTAPTLPPQHRPRPAAAC